MRERETIEEEKEKLEWKGKPKAEPKVRSRGFKILNAIATFISLLAVAAILGIVYYFVFGEGANGGNGIDSGGEFRSCIKRVFSDTPSCEPPSGTGKMETTLNGQNIGPCNKVGNNGCLDH